MPMTVSAIGCVVNGPGEARETNIGSTGGGNGTHQVYINGLTDHRVKNTDIVDHLVELVERKAADIEAAKQLYYLVDRSLSPKRSRRFVSDGRTRVRAPDPTRSVEP